MRRRLTEEEARKALEELDGWRIRGGKLHKEFAFGDFDKAIGFIDKVRPIANRMNHHPEIYNVYDKVVLELVTHDSGGLTKLDFEFAKRVDELIVGREG